MSSAFILRQGKSIHMLTDATSYLLDGTIMQVNISKAAVLATLPAAITCPGPAMFQRHFANCIQNDFASFDDMVTPAGEKKLSEIFYDLARELKMGDAASTVYLIGWHEHENRPGGYAVNYWTDVSSQHAKTVADLSGDDLADAEANRSKLHEIREGVLNGTPMPSLEEAEAAGFELRDTDDYVPAVDLLHLTEIARQDLDENGLSWVGGKAVLTSIDASGITQRVVHHWKEDRVAEKIKPNPVDWKGWREARMPAVPEMSRLRRQMLERKSRKAAR